MLSVYPFKKRKGMLLSISTTSVQGSKHKVCYRT